MMNLWIALLFFSQMGHQVDCYVALSRFFFRDVNVRQRQALDYPTLHRFLVFARVSVQHCVGGTRHF